MYGKIAEDPVVEYYDGIFAVTASNDIQWFVDQARKLGGNVLDLACGTGRIAIALAKAGLDVAALDSSTGMLQTFRDKLQDQSASIQSRINIHKTQMHSFELSSSFSTVICCDAFFHNLTVDDQISCLNSIASHLVERGRFVFNIPNPSIEFLKFASSDKGRQFTKRGEYPLGTAGESVLIEQAQDLNMLDQTITTRFRFTHSDPKGNLIKTQESSWSTRFTFKYEAIHLLHRCGFEVESLEGNYKGRPVKENSQLVFATRLEKK